MVFYCETVVDGAKKATIIVLHGSYNSNLGMSGREKDVVHPGKAKTKRVLTVLFDLHFQSPSHGPL